MNSIRRVLVLIVDIIFYILKGGASAARRKGVKVGSDCRIYIRNFGTEPFLVSIGDRTTVTSGVRILTHDGSTSVVRNASGRRYQRYAPVRIGSDVFIGVNSIIIPGVTIHSRCVVGAGSVVTRDVPEGTVVAGNPARPVKSFDEFCETIRMSCPNDEELEGAKDYQARVSRAIRISAERTEA